MDCRLQVFKLDKEERSSTAIYRVAVVDSSRSKSYPANFVCMLPTKVHIIKGKSTSVFGGLFGDKSLEFAIGLLNRALKSENNVEVKAELARRIKLMDPNKVSLIKCIGCNKTFQPRKIGKYKQNFCIECLKKRLGARQ